MFNTEVYADDMNLLGDNIHIIKKNIETLTNASKEVGLELNIEKTKYMLLSCHQNAWQNHDIKIANRGHHSVQNILSSHLCLKTQIRICKTTILPVVLYWCQTWSLTLREEHKTEGV
jgi:hypothetical protein